jgi:hypothetical protein
MPNIAILVGNTDYKSLAKLECCRADVAAMRELLEATEKYAAIEIIENADANDLKDKIRSAIDKTKSPDELFFYYTGHGYCHETEFFYCATNFDSKRPNETGLSTDDLHTFLRLADADLVIKVVDACNSGTLLVKAEIGLTPQNKQGFKNLIQISSCMDSQSSLTGNPLSLFTEKFRDAALSKTDGVVFYTDIISALRDEFIDNEAQTPFFVSQYTGREEFVDDAHRLDSLREIVRQRRALTTSVAAALNAPPAHAPTLSELLSAAEAKIVKPELMNAFVGTLFDNIKRKLSTVEFSELFDREFTEHPDFQEPTAKPFIIQVLSREKRSDNFVTAEISREHRRRNPLGIGMSSWLSQIYGDYDQYVELHDLSLNCTMPRAQLRATFTPKFSTLQRIILVVTCAPSLEICYVFEIATQHMLRDFGKFDSEGSKVIQRWYKFDWRESTDGVVNKIASSFSEIVKNHIELAAKRITAR